jgi:hypothetical protein
LQLEGLEAEHPGAADKAKSFRNRLENILSSAECPIKVAVVYARVARSLLLDLASSLDQVEEGVTSVGGVQEADCQPPSSKSSQEQDPGLKRAPNAQIRSMM